MTGPRQASPAIEPIPPKSYNSRIPPQPARPRRIHGHSKPLAIRPLALIRRMPRATPPNPPRDNLDQRKKDGATGEERGEGSASPRNRSRSPKSGFSRGVSELQPAPTGRIPPPQDLPPREGNATLLRRHHRKPSAFSVSFIPPVGSSIARER